MAAASVMAISLMSATAFAAPQGIDLRWEAPAACPGRQVVAADLSALSAGTVVAVPPGDAGTVATVVVETRDSGFAMTLTMDTSGSPFERELSSSRCEILARAAALIVVVEVAPVEAAQQLYEPNDIEPGAATETFETRVNVVPTAWPIPRSERKQLESTPRRPLEHRAILALWGGLAVNVVPNTSGLLGGELGWQVRTFSLTLAGWHTFAATRPLSEGVAIQASLSGGGLRAAWNPHVGSLVLRLGVGAEAAVLEGIGVGGGVQGRPTQNFWFAMTPFLGIAWPARSRIRILAQVESPIAVWRPGLHLNGTDGPESAFRAPPAGIRVIVGPQLRIP